MRDEFFYGGHIQSLGATFLLIIYASITNNPFSVWSVFSFYLIVQFVYLADRYLALEFDFETNNNRSRHLQKYEKIIPLVLFIYFASFFVVTFFLGKIFILFVGVFVALTGFLYDRFFKNITKFIPAFKNLFVAVMWVFPIIYFFWFEGFEIEKSASISLMTFIFIKNFLMQICLDIKDIAGDRKKSLKTIPVLLGKQKTLKLLMILVPFQFAPIIFSFILGYLPIKSLVLLVYLLIEELSFYFLIRSKEYWIYIFFISQDLIVGSLFLLITQLH